MVVEYQAKEFVAMSHEQAIAEVEKVEKIIAATWYDRNLGMQAETIAQESTEEPQEEIVQAEAGEEVKIEENWAVPEQVEETTVEASEEIPIEVSQEVPVDISLPIEQVPEQEIETAEITDVPEEEPPKPPEMPPTLPEPKMEAKKPKKKKSKSKKKGMFGILDKKK